jgi:hypothetical protein
VNFSCGGSAASSAGRGTVVEMHRDVGGWTLLQGTGMRIVRSHLGRLIVSSALVRPRERSARAIASTAGSEMAMRSFLACDALPVRGQYVSGDKACAPAGRTHLPRR